ncbi:hypothetical protein [Leifsonia sp. TF02-11]|uniref:hypothetical protein n=1 Tax=Leifsonia sp. TF02-11 TaxID=2815212 RepID=UPI001AA18785|nr:hypothetical protein [Leifsonia sp. TF02-11]MBO1737486.1 hypothetical protein [Leifsonia sp. TF02-11]
MAGTPWPAGGDWRATGGSGRRPVAGTPWSAAGGRRPATRRAMVGAERLAGL